MANIQKIWKLFILQAMRNYQHTSTSMFIGHFALTPEPLVRWGWNFVLRIFHTRGRYGANFSPIRPKKWWSSGPSSLQMTICKRTEEYEGGRIIQMVICNNPCSSIPLILPSDEQSSLQTTICRGTEEARSSGWSFAKMLLPWFWSSGGPSSL